MPIDSLVNSKEFRFYCFTNQYVDTVFFYKSIIELEEVRTWNRGHCNKGTIFKFPQSEGLLEIEESEDTPLFQGAGLYIEVDDVDCWYNRMVSKGFRIKQAISHTSYGHRSFKLEDPNNLS